MRGRAGTWEHGLAPKERRPLARAVPFQSARSKCRQRSAARTRVGSARAGPRPQRERAQWRVSVLHAQATLRSEREGWHVRAGAWRRRNGGLSLVQCPFVVYRPSVAGLAQRARASEALVLGLVPRESELQRTLALHWQSRAKRVVPPSMGQQHTQRAWGLAPASRARHRRLMVPSVAPSQRARSIVPCRLTLAVLQLWLQCALALHWQSHAKRVVPPSMGLQHTQRAWGLTPASRARHRRVMVPSVAPSQRARSIVPCRLTLAVLQPWLQRALALHWQSRAKRVVPPSMGLQHTPRAWGLAPAS